MENIEWGALGFDYHKTDVNVRFAYKNGKWSEMQVTDDEYVQMHMSASCLHYGIELFEGLKAFRGVDGKVRLFRVKDNARRLLQLGRAALPAAAYRGDDRRGMYGGRSPQRTLHSALRYGRFALPASRDVRHDGRFGREALVRGAADRLQPCRCLLQERDQAHYGGSRPRAGSRGTARHEAM